MKEASKRSILRWTHLVTPFEVLPDYAPATRFVLVPAMPASGLWMWKGHVLRKLIANRSTGGRMGHTPSAQRRHGELSLERQE